ncbi:hypothetical protein TNCV_1929561 [Trichonephila clavipes]|nr:hypothetical protein TNCV_1929561 [Trichonephila clavipes]
MYALGRQVAGPDYPPTNKNTLIHALTEEWDKLPQQLLDNVVQTLPQALEKNSVLLKQQQAHKIMFDPSSFADPTPLAHADTSRDVLPRGGKSQG